jgi:nitrogen fixation protein FixH
MINRNNFWPVAIVGVLGVTVLANGVLLYEATRGDATAYESDYYRKAVLWDSTVAQAGRNAALGWRLSGSFDPSGRISVRLVDRAGAPVDRATVSLEGFAIAHGTGDFRATMAEGTDHRYDSTVPLAHGGLHEVRFTAVRGAERFTATLRGTPGGELTPRS